MRRLYTCLLVKGVEQEGDIEHLKEKGKEQMRDVRTGRGRETRDAGNGEKKMAIRGEKNQWDDVVGRGQEMLRARDMLRGGEHKRRRGEKESRERAGEGRDGGFKTRRCLLLDFLDGVAVIMIAKNDTFSEVAV